MKVRIPDHINEEDILGAFTKGKIYQSTRELVGDPYIIDDDGKECFVLVSLTCCHLSEKSNWIVVED